MKEGKPGTTGGGPPKPRPNLKNKNFVKWSKAEPCRKEDNIISTEWHERLQRVTPFTPVYDNAPTNMVYLMSWEYGRMWQKERDEWFSTVFVLNKKENEMESRKRKIRKQAREAKKAAEKSIQARKERKAKEAEMKAKALKADKLKKEKEEKEKIPKKKLPKKSEPKVQPVTSEPEKIENTCPKGWRQVELTVQCECSNHAKKETEKKEKVEKDEETEIKQHVPLTEQQQEEQKTAEKREEPHMCEDYIKQLKMIQEKKENETSKIQET